MPAERMTVKRRRSRRAMYDVANLPPPWKRSLTESGMSRRTTDADRVVVALFLLALAVMLGWVVASLAG